MASGLSDTHPKVEAILMRLYRETPAWRKWELMCELNEMAQGFALAGLHQRHPEATDSEIQRLFAEMILGKEITDHLYKIAPDRIGTVQMSKLIKVLRRFIDVLDNLDILYVIGGSIASTTHAEYRATNDANVLVDLQLHHVDAVAAALGDDFYADLNMMRDAIRRRASFNIIHYQTMLKIDVFIPKGRSFDRQQLQNWLLYSVPSDDSVPEEIYIAKLDWYKMGNEVSEKQWSDITKVIKAQSNQLHLDYMRRTAAELDVSDLLDRALQELDK